MQPSWTDIGVFWISIFASLSAIVSLGLTAFIYLRSAKPEISVYTKQHENQPHLITLVIENTGKAVARDIRFISSESIPQKCFGQEDAKFFSSGPFATGIPSLPPGGKRAFLWGHYHGIFARIGDRSIEIRAKFTYRHPLIGVIADDETHSFVEVQSYHSTDASDNSHMKKIIDAVMGASKALSSIDQSLKARRANMPNQSMEPTVTAVPPAADA